MNIRRTAFLDDVSDIRSEGIARLVVDRLGAVVA
jgi:hypothetical protein